VTIEIRRLAYTPEAFAPLIEEADAAGLAFLSRLRDEWLSGFLRFERPGERLLGAFVDGRLVGVGGMSHDPYQPADGLGRVRHLYVLRAFRRRGIARHLMAEILARAGPDFTTLRLRTNSLEAGRLFESLGFQRADRADETHRLRLQISSANRP